MSKAKETRNKPKEVIKKARVKSEVTKCVKCNKPFSYDPNKGKPELCKACQDAKNEIVFRGVCRDCGKSFYIKAGEAEYLKERGLTLPKRCYECREHHKHKKEKGTENG